jgi:menaquinone-dependent protoporphyrinogen IX oxidase
MNTLIVYRSKYGCTKQYAEWAKEEMASADLADIRSVNANQLSSYDRMGFFDRLIIKKMGGKTEDKTD